MADESVMTVGLAGTEPESGSSSVSVVKLPLAAVRLNT